LAATSSARIIIVAANRLGVVNHTLLTLEAVRSRNLEILGVVLNEIPAEGEDSKENRSAAKAADRSRETNLQLLKEWENTVPISLDIASLVSSI
ncbi:MAG: dethiobiotin synthase, partial [Planctomycetota bacterium]